MIRFGLVWGWWFTCNVNLPWWYPSRTRRQYKSISSDGKRWRTSVAKCKYWPRVFCPPSLIRRKLVRNFTAATAATRRLIWTHCRPKFSHSPGLSALCTKVINPSCENLKVYSATKSGVEIVVVPSSLNKKETAPREWWTESKKSRLFYWKIMQE